MFGTRGNSLADGGNLQIQCSGSFSRPEPVSELNAVTFPLGRESGFHNGQFLHDDGILTRSRNNKETDFRGLASSS